MSIQGGAVFFKAGRCRLENWEGEALQLVVRGRKDVIKDGRRVGSNYRRKDARTDGITDRIKNGRKNGFKI